jgi:transcription antitermination factor NusG
MAEIPPAPRSKVSWYAAYVDSNHEKKAAAEISRLGVESFLPLYRTARRWSDRRVELEMPLFPGYVFVHFALADRLKVLQVSGSVGGDSMECRQFSQTNRLTRCA